MFVKKSFIYSETPQYPLSEKLQESFCSGGAWALAAIENAVFSKCDDFASLSRKPPQFSW